MGASITQQNELVDRARKLNKNCFVFKVDFEKTYDSLSWDCLDYMLGHLGFRDKWRKWIHAIVSSSFTSVLVNGSLTTQFKFRRGLK